MEWYLQRRYQISGTRSNAGATEVLKEIAQSEAEKAMVNLETTRAVDGPIFDGYPYHGHPVGAAASFRQGMPHRGDARCPRDSGLVRSAGNGEGVLKVAVQVDRPRCWLSRSGARATSATGPSWTTRPVASTYT